MGQGRRKPPPWRAKEVLQAGVRGATAKAGDPIRLAAGLPPLCRPSRVVRRGLPRRAIYPALDGPSGGGVVGLRCRSGSAGEGPAWHSPRLRNLFRSLARPSPSARPAARPRQKFFRAFTYGAWDCRFSERLPTAPCMACAARAGPRSALRWPAHRWARGTRAWPGEGGGPHPPPSPGRLSCESWPAMAEGSTPPPPTANLLVLATAGQ